MMRFYTFTFLCIKNKGMRAKIIFLISLFILITGEAFSPHPVFRWDVKTLTDNSGIDWMAELGKAKHRPYASIEALTTQPIQFNSCHDVGTNSRRGDEKRVVRLKVCLVQVKKETNDNDFHIVIQSLTNSNNKMVAEIPDPGDEEYNGPEYANLRTLFAGLRTTIETLLNNNVTTQFKNFPAGTNVKIYGVPFWDCKHPGNVNGASVDFRELHPVLEIDQF
jgi:hypothetical protein